MSELFLIRDDDGTVAVLQLRFEVVAEFPTWEEAERYREGGGRVSAQVVSPPVAMPPPPEPHEMVPAVPAPAAPPTLRPQPSVPGAAGVLQRGRDLAWTEEEDAALIEARDHQLPALAATFGRSLFTVAQRQKALHARIAREMGA